MRFLIDVSLIVLCGLCQMTYTSVGFNKTKSLYINDVLHRTLYLTLSKKQKDNDSTLPPYSSPLFPTDFQELLLRV